MAVRMELSVVRETARSAGRSIVSRQTNSAARCWASCGASASGNEELAARLHGSGGNLGDTSQVVAMEASASTACRVSTDCFSCLCTTAVSTFSDRFTIQVYTLPIAAQLASHVARSSERLATAEPTLVASSQKKRSGQKSERRKGGATSACSKRRSLTFGANVRMQTFLEPFSEIELGSDDRSANGPTKILRKRGFPIMPDGRKTLCLGWRSRVNQHQTNR